MSNTLDNAVEDNPKCNRLVRYLIVPIMVLGAGLMGLAGYSAISTKSVERAIQAGEVRQASYSDNVDLSERGKLSEANKDLADFPDRLLGAEKIVKYPFNDAKHCLVHIKQIHLNEHENNIDKINDPSVAKNQRNIYNILNSLISIKKLNEVYSEGLTADYKKGIENCKKEQKLENFLIDSDAQLALYISGKLELLVAENPEDFNGAAYILSEGLKVVKKGDKQKAIVLNKELKRYQEKRENYVLELMDKQKDPLNVCVYGAAHDWKDNISEWNSKHPNDKFSLIEVYPYGLSEEVKK
jgi:hypothetical protein